MDAQKLLLQNAKSVEAVNREQVVNIKILQEESREKLKLAEFQRKISTNKNFGNTVILMMKLKTFEKKSTLNFDLRIILDKNFKTNLK